MIKLTLKRNLARPEYAEDVIALRQQLLLRGYVASDHDISFAWQSFSDSVCAGWMCLSNNVDENVENILPFFDEQTEILMETE